MNFPSLISKILLLNNFKFPLNNSYKVLPTLTSPMIILQPTSLQKKPYANLCQLDFLRFVLVCCSIWLHALPSFSCPSVSPIVSNGKGF